MNKKRVEKVHIFGKIVPVMMTETNDYHEINPKPTRTITREKWVKEPSSKKPLKGVLTKNDDDKHLSINIYKYGTLQPTEKSYDSKAQYQPKRLEETRNEG